MQLHYQNKVVPLPLCKRGDCEICMAAEHDNTAKSHPQLRVMLGVNVQLQGIP